MELHCKIIHARVLISIGKPVNRADHVDYVPTVFVHTSAVTPVMVAQIEEREKRVLWRRMRQTNDQDIGHTKRRRTAHGKGIVGGD